MFQSILQNATKLCDMSLAVTGGAFQVTETETRNHHLLLKIIVLEIDLTIDSYLTEFLE